MKAPIDFKPAWREKDAPDPGPDYAEDHFPDLRTPYKVHSPPVPEPAPTKDYVIPIACVFAGVVSLGMLVYACTAHGRELYPGQYAQVPDSVQKWYKSIKTKDGVPCCDISDGHKTEYSVDAEGIYWVPINGNWQAVPPHAVIYTAGNPEDTAVVWYVPIAGGIQHIRCFVPNGGV